MTPLLNGPYFSAWLDPARDLVLVKRSPAPFSQPEEIPKTFSFLCERLEDWATPGRRLLFDVQGGPLRTDDAFENALRPLLTRLHAAFARFERHAVLVRSAVGKLQITRHQREHNASGQTIFRDEAEARAYLGEYPADALRRQRG